MEEETLRDFPGCPVVESMSSNAGDSDSISGWGTKIPHAVLCGQKKKKGFLKKRW